MLVYLTTLLASQYIVRGRMNDKFGWEETWSNRGSIAAEVQTRPFQIQALTLTETPKCFARSDVTGSGKNRYDSLDFQRTAILPQNGRQYVSHLLFRLSLDNYNATLFVWPNTSHWGEWRLTSRPSIPRLWIRLSKSVCCIFAREIYWKKDGNFPESFWTHCRE